MLHMETSGLIFGGRLRCLFSGRFLPTARCFQTWRDIAPFLTLWLVLLASMKMLIYGTLSAVWYFEFSCQLHYLSLIDTVMYILDSNNSLVLNTTAPAPSWNTLLRKGCNSLRLRSHTCRPPPKTNFLIVIFRLWDEVQMKQRQVAWRWLKAFPWTTSLRIMPSSWPLGGPDARKILTAQNAAAIKDQQKTWSEENKQHFVL